MSGYNAWFGVDKAGLAQLAERRDGKVWLLHELISNAWDEASATVTVRLTPEDGKPYVTIEVIDDSPNGFANLAHAWTLFASSAKRSDAEKRGVFTLGEKLVLSLCTEAVIKTTTGAVLFSPTGRHMRNQWKTAAGSVFEGTVRMTRAELDEVRGAMRRLIPPQGVRTTIDGTALVARSPEVEIAGIALPTVIADADGVMRRTQRQTTVELYQPLPGEVPALYELGIPVVETGDALHVLVRQKVPLNMERDNVTPGYLRQIRGLALQHGHHLLTTEDQRQPWVTAALAEPTVTPAVVGAVLDSRFGADRVAADPSDREAEKIAASRGHTVVHGGSLPGAVWAKAKEHGLIKPAGQVTPSPKPFHADGAPLVHASADDVARIRRGIAAYRWLGRVLVEADVAITIADDPSWAFRAAYGRTTGLTLNLAKLGFEHFIEPARRDELFALAIHEFAHHTERDHLAAGFHEACCRLGAKLAITLAGIGLSEAVWAEIIGVRS